MSIGKLFDYTQPLVAASTILASGLVALGAIGGLTAYRIKTASDIVSVTGSAREAVTADYARLILSLETHTPIDGQVSGLATLDAATKRVAATLKDKGLEDIEMSIGYTAPQYAYPEKSAPVLTGYSVSRQVIVRSKDIAKMQETANSVEPFMGKEYTVSISTLEFTYRGLDEMRVRLLAKAIADAKARAKAIADESGRSVGALRTSSSGVVQVLPKGGVDVSDYGTYDTQSIEKEIMVTVRAGFSLE